MNAGYFTFPIPGRAQPVSVSIIAITGDALKDQLIIDVTTDGSPQRLTLRSSNPGLVAGQKSTLYAPSVSAGVSILRPLL